jgi:hypothetical protein
MTYTVEEAQEMARALSALPAMDDSKRRLSKQGVVTYLATEIAALQQRGYPLEQVAESLRGVGLTITTPTLKSYLQRTKTKPVKSAPRKHKPGVTAPPGESREKRLNLAVVSEPKTNAAVERSGKQAFLVKDKDSY